MFLYKLWIHFFKVSLILHFSENVRLFSSSHSQKPLRKPERKSPESQQWHSLLVTTRTEPVNEQQQQTPHGLILRLSHFKTLAFILQVILC